MPELLRANETDFMVEVDGAGAELTVIRFTGRESLSGLFEFTIHVEAGEPDIDAASVIGQNAVFTINSQGFTRVIKGIVSRFQFSGVSDNVSLYDLRIVPGLALLTHRFNCRIFQDKSAVEIMTDVIDGSGACQDGWVVSEAGSLQPLTYCVQYRESDLNFICRLAEQNGFFYFFDYRDGGTELIFSDDSNVHPEIEDTAIQFHVAGGTQTESDFIYDLNIGLSLRTAKHTVRDYNYESPDLDLTKEHTGAGDTELENYDYPGQFDSQAGGSSLAEIKSQSDDCLRSICRGKSNSVRLAPGYKFDLTDYPVDSINDSYLITAVTHTGEQPTPGNAADNDAGYSNSIQFQKSEIPYRPVLRSRKPRIEGSQTATVSGPDGHEIYSDKYGRIKVKFHWDRSDVKGDQRSCWIRVAQKWAGKSWGAVFIPRIGQEVLVDFLEGDPDRPIIAGCVYNGTNVTPYDLPDDQTISTIKSESSMGGGGYNEFKFEDKKGSELIHIHAQKNYDTKTLNNKTASVGANESLKVGKNRTRSVGTDESVSVGGKRNHSVAKDETISISDNQSISIGKSLSSSVGKNETHDISENYSQSIGKDSSVSIGKKQSVSVAEDRSLQVGKDLTISVGKKYGLTVASSLLISSDKDITLKCGSASISMKKNGDITIKGKKINIKGSGDIIMKGSKIIQN